MSKWVEMNDEMRNDLQLNLRYESPEIHLDLAKQNHHTWSPIDGPSPILSTCPPPLGFGLHWAPGKGFLAADESAGPWLRAGHAEAAKIPEPSAIDHVWGGWLGRGRPFRFFLALFCLDPKPLSVGFTLFSTLDCSVEVLETLCSASHI